MLCKLKMHQSDQTDFRPGSSKGRELMTLPKPPSRLGRGTVVNSQLTVQDLWDNPAAVADFLNLDN